MLLLLGGRGTECPRQLWFLWRRCRWSSSWCVCVGLCVCVCVSDLTWPPPAHVTSDLTSTSTRDLWPDLTWLCVQSTPTIKLKAHFWASWWFQCCRTSETLKLLHREDVTDWLRNRKSLCVCVCVCECVCVCDSERGWWLSMCYYRNQKFLSGIIFSTRILSPYFFFTFKISSHE